MPALTSATVRNTVFSLSHQLALAPRLWNASARSLPDFLIIGTPRCGTTSLFHLLCRHPKVMRSLYKEIGYFTRNYYRGENWYRAHFPTLRAKGDAVTGEATPGYSTRAEVPGRVRDLVPHCRFILLVRNPVDRLLSSFHFRTSQGDRYGAFERAVRDAIESAGQESDGATQPPPGTVKMRSGLYYETLLRWYDVFPREQILVIETGEALNTTEGMEKLCRHLGIPVWMPDRQERRNTASYPPMDPALRQELVRFYEPHNRKLYNLLGYSFHWE